MTNTRTLFWILLYAAMSALWYGLWRADPHIADEHRAMENFEMACLLLGIIFLGATSLATANSARVLCCGLSLLYLTMAVLELDSRKMDAAQWFVRITNGKIRNLWLGSLWAIGAVFFLRRAPYQTLARFFYWLGTPAGRPLVFSGVFWIGSFFAEKRFHAGLFVEELLECIAALLMMQSAWLTFRLLRSEQAAESGRARTFNDAPQSRDE